MFSVSFGSIIYSPDGSKEIITKEKYLNDLATFNSKKTGPPGANLFVFHLPNEHKDSDLMEILDKVELDTEIPLEVFAIVAEIFAFVYRTNQKAKDTAAV